MLAIAGKNNIACDLLEYALERIDHHEICAIVNQTDQGIDGWQRSFKKAAAQWNTPIVPLESVYGVPNLIFLSLEFDTIIRPDLFQSTRLYNIHFSLLPKYRGMYTSAWPILNNESESGVTLHCIDWGIDTGAIIDQIAFPITITDNGKDLYLKYIRYGTELTKKNFDLLLSGEIVAKPQNRWNATYYSRKSINYKDLKIDFQQPAIAVYNQIRAFSFDVYQLPIVYNRTINRCVITDDRSRGKAGAIIRQDQQKMTVSTLDFDVILYFSMDQTIV
jgi:methionyl-tRNA formyltransferase